MCEPRFLPGEYRWGELPIPELGEEAIETAMVLSKYAILMYVSCSGTGYPGGFFYRAGRRYAVHVANCTRPSTSSPWVPVTIEHAPEPDALGGYEAGGGI